MRAQTNVGTRVAGSPGAAAIQAAPSKPKTASDQPQKEQKAAKADASDNVQDVGKASRADRPGRGAEAEDCRQQYADARRGRQAAAPARGLPAKRSARRIIAGTKRGRMRRSS